MNRIENIRAHLDQAELLTQLAEEAAELAQAALKLRRARTRVNPSLVGSIEALDNLLEELADVSVCVRVLGLDRGPNLDQVHTIMDKKLERWATRLEGTT